MSHRHDDADPVEHDPTGMRALLGSLPDPGPMPDRLVARITAALEEESRTAGDTAAEQSGGWVPPPPPGELAGGALGPPAGDDATVVPLRRRRTWLLGAAAAAVLAVVAGGVVIEQLAPGGLQASLGLAQGSDDSAAGSAPQSAAESGGDAADAGGAPSGDAAEAARAPKWTPTAADRALRVRILDGSATTSYPEVVVRDLRVPPYTAFPTDSGQPLQASKENVGWPKGARDCATGVGVPADTPVAVVLSDGDDGAAVLVALEPGGTRRAWLVGPTCSVDDADVRSGPVTAR